MRLAVDSPVITAGIKMTNMLILNLCWVLGCVPVITIGASTTAAYTVLLKMAEDREDAGIMRSFWKAWAANLRHGIVFTIILGVAAYSEWILFQLFSNVEGNPIWFLIMVVLLVFLVVVHFIYVFPLDARYENGVLRQLQNSRIICMRFWTKTLALAGVVLIQLALFLFVNPVLTYAGLFFAPVLIMYSISRVVMDIFRQLEKDAHADDGLAVTAQRDW